MYICMYGVLVGIEAKFGMLFFLGFCFLPLDWQTSAKKKKIENCGFAANRKRRQKKQVSRGKEMSEMVSTAFV